MVKVNPPEKVTTMDEQLKENHAASGEMTIQMSARLENPLSEEQAIAYMKTLRSIGEVHVWRRPRKDLEGNVFHQEIFLKCWPQRATLAAEVLATIADEHPANKDVQRRYELAAQRNRHGSHPQSFGTMVRNKREEKQPAEAVPEVDDALLTEALTINPEAMDKAYNKGIADRKSGCNLDANPFDLNSNATAMQHMSWIDGWNDGS